MKALLAFLFCLSFPTVVQAAELPFVMPQEVEGWKASVMEAGRSSPFPTAKFAPTNGRNASVLFTYLGKADPRLAAPGALRKLHVFSCERGFARAGQAFEVKELAWAGGKAYYSTFEDPALVGKAPVKDNFKFSTSLFIQFMGGELGSATVFTDEPSGKTFTEAMAIVQTISVRPTSGKAEPLASTAGLDNMVNFTTAKAGVTLGFPPEDLEIIPLSGQAASNRFSFVRKDGLIVSGWLDATSAYPGFLKMWAADKKRMEEGMGVKLEGEKIEMISGWHSVTYTIKISEGVVQRNLRACRTSGGSWVDVHLSRTGNDADFKSLREFLGKIVVQPK